ncbi:MAG: CDP-alcohol phosphatidyltransferase family protein [Sphingobacteriales bacterium]|nr:CDP-alcohol phosphatidyltransferase family protein [Sphingobacteriales bacterium]MBI3717271.1 CDP-alcohol phosphatidyltransferase family protein [Sphingobacteriales bacterium]
MKQIPNLFTLLNLVFGCIAIIFILQTGESIVSVNDNLVYQQLPEKITWGCICIGIAAVIDFLDGFVARLFNATSEMGKQLDSLADVVSFGVAPGMILFQLLRISFAGQDNGLDVSIAWLLPAFIFPAAGAYRLARFNIDASQQYGFKGVPIPAAGLMVASLPFIAFYNSFDLINVIFNKWFLYAVILLMSWLMVSTLPLMALKFKDFSIKNNLPKFILLGIAVVAAIIFKWAAFPVVFIAYVVLSLAFKNQKA